MTDTAQERCAAQRAAVRDALDAALTGIRLSHRDQQFLGRLVHWDKRNAACVATLLSLARHAGREEAALPPRQLDVLLSALSDAIVYRGSGADAMGCWDCESVPAGQCAEHARDADRARAYADLASSISGGIAPAMLGRAAPGRPTGVAGYLRRAPVAS